MVESLSIRCDHRLLSTAFIVQCSSLVCCVEVLVLHGGVCVCINLSTLPLQLEANGAKTHGANVAVPLLKSCLFVYPLGKSSSSVVQLKH